MLSRSHLENQQRFGNKLTSLQILPYSAFQIENTEKKRVSINQQVQHYHDDICGLRTAFLGEEKPGDRHNISSHEREELVKLEDQRKQLADEEDVKGDQEKAVASTLFRSLRKAETQNIR